MSTVTGDNVKSDSLASQESIQKITNPAWPNLTSCWLSAYLLTFFDICLTFGLFLPTRFGYHSASITSMMSDGLITQPKPDVIRLFQVPSIASIYLVIVFKFNCKL